MMDLDHDPSQADALVQALGTRTTEGAFPASDSDAAKIVQEHQAGQEHDQEQHDEDDDEQHDGDLAKDLFGDDDDEDEDDDDPAEADPTTTNEATNEATTEATTETVPLPELFSDHDHDNPNEMNDFIAPPDDEALTPEEVARRRQLEYSERTPSPGTFVTKTETKVALPLANLDVPQGGKVWHARLPHFLGLETQPFDDLMWEPPPAKQAHEMMDENVIRWRWSKHELDQVIKQSNARIVRWSDGSLSLQLGSELFDMSVALDQSALLTSSSSTIPVMPSSTTSLSLTTSSDRAHGLTYLVASHDYTELLEAQASVHGTLTFRPTTLQSATHRRLAGHIHARNLKSVRTKIADLPTFDPEKLKAQRERMEQDKRKKAHKERKKAGSRGARRNRGSVRLEGIEFSSDEEGEDGGIGAARGGAGRSQPKRGKGGPLAQDYDDDDDDDDDDGFIRPDDEEEEEGEGDRQDDDDDERMEVDDQMERAEKAMELERRKRKEEKRLGHSGGKDTQASNNEASEPVPAPRRRLVVESDEDE